MSGHSSPKQKKLKSDWLPAAIVVAMIALHSPFSAAATVPVGHDIVSTEKAPAALGPYSQAVRAGDTLYLSGQLPIVAATGDLPADTGIESQTRQVLDNIKAIVQADGLSMDDIVLTTVYLKDLNNFSKVNEVYAQYFSGNFPARVTVEVSRLPKGAALEIASVARRH